MTFLPSGMDDIETSSLARARTSAEADSVVTRSTTVDLAAAADKTPIEPTMKYETLRVTAGLAARYLVKSGAATGSRAAGGDEWNERRWGADDGAGERIERAENGGKGSASAWQGVGKGSGAAGDGDEAWWATRKGEVGQRTSARW